MNPWEILEQRLASLMVYQQVFAQPAGQAWVQLLAALRSSKTDLRTPQSNALILRSYGAWFQRMAVSGLSWQDFGVREILQAENPFSDQAQTRGPILESLIPAAQHDLAILQEIFQTTHTAIQTWVTAVTQQALPDWNPPPMGATPDAIPLGEDWSQAIPELIQHYQQQGTGIFQRYRAFRWQAGRLVGISHPDPVSLNTLVGYENQRDLLLKNTEFLLAGYPALHVLLYGSRGSGKSSLIKALINYYWDRPLRLIEVSKSDLADLNAIAEQLRPLSLKFILFVDDLSFEDDDDAFKALKVVLEGNVTARPQNMVVYATSNRRHLIREFHSDRPRPQAGDEIFAWDTVQEKLSFSDRFGLTLTFEPANQDCYLAMVHHLAACGNLDIAPADLEFQALQWATRHNGRSGRTARQFIDFLTAELALNHAQVGDGTPLG